MRPKVYRFMYLYKHRDSSVNETKIIAKLDKKGITHLMHKFSRNSKKDLFPTKPILIEVPHNVLRIDGYTWIKMIGYVYALDENEAIRIIQNERFGSDSENDTPKFFR